MFLFKFPRINYKINRADREILTQATPFLTATQKLEF